MFVTVSILFYLLPPGLIHLDGWSYKLDQQINKNTAQISFILEHETESFQENYN